MCLVAIAWRAHPRWPLALIANRDEAHARPSAPAGFDPEAPAVYGGRDLVQGGSWLQASGGGRLAALTNIRGPAPATAPPDSRGWLVRDFVRGSGDAAGDLAALSPRAARCGPFNLLAWDGSALYAASNQPGYAAAPVAAGLHAMSNGTFDAPWPKAVFATRVLGAWLDSPLAGIVEPEMETIEPLFTALRDTTPAPDALLPETGVGIDLERRLSPPFVLDPVYGTRCSSVVLAGPAGVLFAERRYESDGRPAGTSLAWLR